MSDVEKIARAIDPGAFTYTSDVDGSLVAIMRRDNAMQAAQRALAAMGEREDSCPVAEGVEHYPLKAFIWRRTNPGYEGWVLDISGDINDTSFTCRHSEPLTTPPEDVAGLPSLYASPRPEAVDEMVKAGIAASEAMDAIDAYHKHIRPEQPRIPQSVISALYAAYQVAHKAKRETPDG